MKQKEEVEINKKWKILCDCRDFSVLKQNVSPGVLDLLEKQINEYLNLSEITESYLDNVPLSICWYEGLVDTEMLLLEMKDYVFL